MTRTPTLDLCAHLRSMLAETIVIHGGADPALTESVDRLKDLHEIVLEMVPHVLHAQAQQHRISSEPTPLDGLVQRLREEVGS